MKANEYSHRTVVKETVQSRYLEKERHLRVFLPPGYNELVTHRVIYCQDGEQCFNFGRIATHATRLILEEGFDPFLIVGVDVDMPNRTAEYAPDGERSAHYRRFFVEEVVPFVESQYPVRTGEGDRIAVGDSLGGTVSLHLSLDVPHLIQKVVALSGAFLDSSVEAVESVSDLSWLRLYQLIGTNETSVGTQRGTFDFLHRNREMRETLIRKGAAVEYVEREGQHVWGFWQRELPDALRWALSD